MRPRIRILIVVVVMVAAVGLLTYRSIQPRIVQASSVEVKIDNFTFAPNTIRVRAGTRITWTNRDDIPHTVVEEGKIFKSKVLDTDEMYTYTPTTPGTYRYYCSIHPKMTAKLIVE